MNTQTQSAKPMTIVRSGLRRPNWISRLAQQDVILCRDASGSMRGQKARDASTASLDLVAELADPANKDGFNVAVVDFSSASKIIHNLEKATALNGRVSPLSVGLFSGSTNITTSLEDAVSILENADQHKSEGVNFLRPVTILFTDGCHNDGPDPQVVADRLKLTADLLGVAFGSDADEALLHRLASTSQHVYRCTTGRELRKFLAAVGATMTATMAAGTNATQALTTIRQ